MSEFVSYVIEGIPYGCVFALVAIGLVLTYKTSGVFNLAFGAQAFVSAAIYYDTRSRNEWGILPAFLVAVVVAGPVVGLVLDRLVFRFLRTAPPIAKLVASLGLLVAIPELVRLWFGTNPAYNPPSIAPDHDRIYTFGDYELYQYELISVVVTVLVVLGLTALFRYTAIGLRMRAVVESPRMTELNGINADWVGSLGWILSSLFAGLAGVLLAPLFAQIRAEDYTLLLVAALAAAAFGKLTNIGLTFLGAIILGIAQQVAAGTLPTDSILATGLRPSLPFVMLFLLLLFWPGLRNQREAQDPLAGVDPPPRALDVAPSRGRTTRLVTVVAAVVAVVVGYAVLDAFWMHLVIQAMIMAVIFLSITVITGMGGMISLSQASFAAVGAFTTAQLVERFDVPVLLTILAGTVLAGIVGAILALPILRLGGIYLALATLAFGLMFDNIVAPLDWAGGGNYGALTVPRPEIGPIDLGEDPDFYLFTAVVLGLVVLAALLVRSGTVGRFLDALRGSEAAATSLGINPARIRVTAFGLSAAIAGLGGGLLATFNGSAQPSDFISTLGLFWVVIVVTMGDRTVLGALAAAAGFVLVPQWLSDWDFAPGWQYILFGLASLTFARHPEGIVEWTKRSLVRGVETVEALRALRAARAPAPATATGAPAATGADVASDAMAGKGER
ncbi:MAG TPA: ABC transporter permease [Acidimicrobiales bacterium]|nr:ABC transporter permease [Acidimicrobiales bacterium]